MGVRAAIARIADAVFPYVPKCVICGVEKGVTDYLCGRCRSGLDELKVGESLSGGFAAFSLFKYDGAVKRIVAGYKYGGKKYLGEFLGADMAKHICALPQSFACVCGVPLHEKRRRSRGFDQSEELAKSIAKAAGLPYVPTLRRIRNTKTQTRLSEKQRQENIRGAFEAACAVTGSVLLVDDVLTTGDGGGVRKDADGRRGKERICGDVCARGDEGEGRKTRIGKKADKKVYKNIVILNLLIYAL